ncbi:MAG: hypothetical protein AAGK32_03795, partial [Actinomycetota bacterium]
MRRPDLVLAAHAPDLHQCLADARRVTGELHGRGIGLLVVGWAGSIFARMIQAAVSRQREFLAD